MSDSKSKQLATNKTNTKSEKNLKYLRNNSSQQSLSTPLSKDNSIVSNLGVSIDKSKDIKAPLANKVTKSAPPSDYKKLVGTDIVYTRETLCFTVAGIPCPLITITAPSTKKNPLSKRKAVIISSRVHPGESVASYVFEGLFNFLMST